MTRLIHSSKFWLWMLDAVVSVVTYFVSKYALPQIGNDILWVIALIQPGVIMVIKSYTDEDVAEKSTPKPEPQA